MRFQPIWTILTVLAAYTTLVTAQYTLTDDLSHTNFLEGFEFFHDQDPTNGFVAYQTIEAAIQNKYIGYLNTSVILGVDSTNVTPAGRPSIRAESKKTWNHGLLLADIRHMPDSTCGTWPAFWMLGSGAEWPMKGEIDILEGVNDEENNAVTLHTTAGCVVDGVSADANAPFTGNMVTHNCDIQAADQAKNQGCSIKAPAQSDGKKLPTYGTDFNAAGGGIYALEWTSTSISVWLIPRDSPLASNLSSSPTTMHPDPSTFGTPLAHFAGSSCDFDARFKDMKVIFDTTFCGEWAGAPDVWDKSCKAKTGSETCDAFVRDHPEAFADAYWEIDGLRWFQSSRDETEKSGRGSSSVNNPKMRGRTYRW
ncbi:glycoside hydrolase family 16 protein [Pleomassaria siparia CBS 279.74]|uniref:endo-1,3(4)-beta-glucanase n=1 Tax=Pleomassaria siparia CBS 279.74 TaxID=1314801 RepID=A0A6G1JVP4_9PLEO|nr:glycoside hydrolase family 16 protein [Pleomassaria siparia CBS 279.74]